ncbi:protein of unknown function [Hyphomicrobium sp. MC1]|nr:protein of unknown function [Hyphomicrobium sp. MC1]
MSTAFVRRSECVPNFAGSRPDAGDLLQYQPHVLPRCQPTSVATAGEEKLARLALRQTHVLVNGLSRLISLEANRPPHFLLADGRLIHLVTAWNNVIDAEGSCVQRVR